MFNRIKNAGRWIADLRGRFASIAEKTETKAADEEQFIHKMSKRWLETVIGILKRKPTENSYCESLFAVYNDLRERSLLLSTVKNDPDKLVRSGLKAFALRHKMRFSEAPRGITLNELRNDPRQQAAAATAYIPNKWLLEQELASRDSNIGDLHWRCLRSYSQIVPIA
jgi:hypothetical protein